MTILEDLEFYEEVLDEVRECDDGYEIGRKGTFLFMSKESGIVPKVGDVARFYGKGFGFPIRGLMVDGKIVYHRTPEQEEERHRKWCEDLAKRKRQDFEKGKAQLDEQYASLPPEFQARLDRFRRNRPDFRWKSEPYEMSVCVDAVKIAMAMKTGEEVKRFGKLKWKQQKELIPDLYDGHSGNSFGCAVHLAFMYLVHPNLVEKDHGALCPLVGCEEYGCYASEKKEEIK